MGERHVLRSLSRIEAAVCFVLGVLIGGWLGAFWFVLGFTELLGFWRWVERRAAVHFGGSDG